MAIQKTVISFAVMWFSAIGASALSIYDIGLMVLPDNGNGASTGPNNGACTLADFNLLAVDLDTKSVDFDSSYVGRRQLQADNEDAIIDSNIMDSTQGHRKLINCATACAGFCSGCCKVVYPECAPRRGLEEKEPMKVTVATTTNTENLRGSNRELQTSSSAPTVLANGFMSGYSTNLGGAAKLCADLKAGLNANVTSVPDRLGLTGSCKNLWRKSLRIGCVYMPGL